MKNFSRVLSVVMAIAMLFTMSMSVSAATYTDVAATDSYYEAVEALSALGVVKGYEAGDFQPEGKITRAEAAAIIMRIMGMAAVEDTRINTQFSDVTSEHWASGIIAAAADSAIVNGMGDGTFAPSAEVTYDQVVKMLVCAMGYQKKAEASVAAGTNVFPTGYNIVANQKRITEGTTKTEGGATRGTVARLVYNALTVNLMDQTSFGSDIEFKEIPTQSILYTKLNAVQIETKIAKVSIDPTETKITLSVSKYDDVATQNGYTVAGKAVVAGQSQKAITTVKKGDVNLAGLQGLTVKALIDISDAADPVLLAVFPTAGKNAELVVDPQLFENFTQVTGGTDYNANIRYYKDAEATQVNTSSKIEASAAAPFVAYINLNYTAEYASVNAAAAGLNTLLGGANKITTNNKAYRFVDTDNNGLYDTLFIDNSASFVVGKINASDYEIYRDGASSIFNSSYTFGDNSAQYPIIPLDLNTEDEDVSYVIKDSEGNELAFEDIKVGDVLTVAWSFDGSINYYDITVSSAAAVEGTITEVTTEKVKGTSNTITYYVIDGTPYRVNGAASASKLEAGVAGTFNITADGAIISYELEASAKAYGIVIATAKKQGSFSNGVQAQIMTKDGTIKTFDFASKTYVYNDTTKDTPAETVVDTTLAGADATLAGFLSAGEIVIYETNADEEIRKIYASATAVSNKENGDAKIEAIAKGSTNGAEYVAASGKIDGKYITDETVVIGVKEGASLGAKDSYSFASIDALADGENYYGDFVIDTNSKEVTLAFIHNLTVKPAYDSIPFVVTGKSTTNVDGSTRAKFTGLVENKEVSYVLADDEDLTIIGMTGAVVSSTVTKAQAAAFDIGVNDVIQIVLNANEEIVSYRHVMKYDVDEDASGADTAEGYIAMIATTGDEDSDGAETAVLTKLSDGTVSAHNAAIATAQIYGYAVAGRVNKVTGRGIEIFKSVNTTTLNTVALLTASTNIIDAAYNPNNIVYAYGDKYSKVKTTVFDAVKSFDTVGTGVDANLVADLAKADDVVYLYSFDGTNVLGFIVDVNSNN